MSESEVARQMRYIEESCEAIQRVFSGYTVKAPHWLINMQYHTLENHTQRLAELVGEKEADAVSYDIYKKTVK